MMRFDAILPITVQIKYIYGLSFVWVCRKSWLYPLCLLKNDSMVDQISHGDFLSYYLYVNGKYIQTRLHDNQYAHQDFATEVINSPVKI